MNIAHLEDSLASGHEEGHVNSGKVSLHMDIGMSRVDWGSGWHFSGDHLLGKSRVAAAGAAWPLINVT